MKKALSWLPVLICMIGVSHAQQELMVSQYMFNGLYLNPAYAGSHDYMEITALHRQQWVQFDGAPISQILSAEGIIKNKNSGWGAILTNDKIGVSYKTDLYGNYAYQIRLTEKTRLALGARGGVSYCRAMLNQLTYWDQNDVVFASNVKNRFIPNVGAGAYLFSEKFYAGISVPNIINYDPATTLSISNMANNIPRYVRHYYATAGYVFEVTENLQLKPSFLIKYVEGAPMQADLNFQAMFNKSLFVGVSYRTLDGLVAMVEYQPDNNWRIGYAYDQPLTMLRNYSIGSHEIMVSYMFRKQEGLKIKSPRFF